jgi:hypothetical protein
VSAVTVSRLTTTTRYSSVMMRSVCIASSSFFRFRQDRHFPQQASRIIANANRKRLLKVLKSTSPRLLGLFWSHVTKKSEFTLPTVSLRVKSRAGSRSSILSITNYNRVCPRNRICPLFQTVQNVFQGPQKRHKSLNTQISRLIKIGFDKM